MCKICKTCKMSKTCKLCNILRRCRIFLFGTWSGHQAFHGKDIGQLWFCFDKSDIRGFSILDITDVKSICLTSKIIFSSAIIFCLDYDCRLTNHTIEDTRTQSVWEMKIPREPCSTPSIHHRDCWLGWWGGALISNISLLNAGRSVNPLFVRIWRSLAVLRICKAQQILWSNTAVV